MYQGIISQHGYPNECGPGLFIDGDGRVRFYLGDGGKYQKAQLHAGPALTKHRWHHIVGVWDGTTKSLWLDGKRLAQWKFEGPLRPGKAALRLASFGHAHGGADRFLDGDLAMLVIYDKALSPEEIAKRFAQRGSQQAEGNHVLACWPLSEERGDRVADVSANKRHGRIINHATWMVGGPDFDADAVPRYDAAYDTARDAKRGHGLRFCSDDLLDCRWAVTHEYRLPSNARSGIYVGRYRFQLDGKPAHYDVTFIVTPPAKRKRPPILVLCSTNTWLAYSSTAFAKNVSLGLRKWDTTGIANGEGNPPSFSQYRVHHYSSEQPGPPVYQQGFNLPWPAAGPQATYSDAKDGYSHLTRGERFLHVWLDRNGYEYDLVTDYDLHRNPDMLKEYKVLAINGHSEYWSAEAYDGVDRYLKAGGNVAVFSGNTMFWRVSYSEDGSVMECRKFDRDAAAREGSTLGEIWHSHDGRRGGLSCECGYPAWKVVGLEFLGWSSSKVSTFQAYEVDTADHFLFQQPEKVGVKPNEFFGKSPDGLVPIALGHEWDVRLSTMAKLTPQAVSRGRPNAGRAQGHRDLGSRERCGTPEPAPRFFHAPRTQPGRLPVRYDLLGSPGRRPRLQRRCHRVWLGALGRSKIRDAHQKRPPPLRRKSLTPALGQGLLVEEPGNGFAGF